MLRREKFWMLVLPVLAACWPAPLLAQDAFPPERPLAAWLGLQLMAAGRIAQGSDMNARASSTAPGLALSTAADYRIARFLRAGIAPKIIFNVNSSEGAEKPARQYDLAARLTAISPGENTRWFAHLSPGYSWLHLPATFVRGQRSEGVTVSAPHGPVVDLAVGLQIETDNDRYLSLGAGYQIGWQVMRAARAGGSTDVDRYTRYLHVDLIMGFGLL